MRQIILIFLVGIFITVSCNKNSPDNYNPYNLTEEVEEVEEVEEPTSVPTEQDEISFKRQIVKTNLILKDLIYLTFRQLQYHPEVLGMFQDPNSAQVRACPNSSTSGAFPDYFLTLDFGGSTGCTTTGVTPAQTEYKGEILAEFETELFDGVSGKEFTITSVDFEINGYEISDVNLEFSRKVSSSGNISYEIEILDDITVIKGDTATTIPATESFGFLKNGADGMDPPDMNHLPATFIDNEFKFSITDEVIVCENTLTGTEKSFCVDTTIDMVLKPSTCGCIRDGKLRILDEPDCSTAETIYYFDAEEDGSNPTTPDCDEWVEEEDQTTGVVTNLRMDSC